MRWTEEFYGTPLGGCARRPVDTDGRLLDGQPEAFPLCDLPGEHPHPPKTRLTGRGRVPAVPRELQGYMDSLPTEVALSYAHELPVSAATGHQEIVVVLRFSEKGFGFGEIRITQTRDGLFINTEHMGLESARRYFGLLFDRAITELDQDPEKHARYKRATRTSCGPACPACGGTSEEPEKP